MTRTAERASRLALALVIAATVVTLTCAALQLAIATLGLAWEGGYGPCGAVGAPPDCRSTQWTAAMTALGVVTLLLLGAGWALTTRGHRWWGVVITGLAIPGTFLATYAGSRVS